MVDTYHIFDTTLSCDFPLPELQKSAQASASLAIKLADSANFDSSRFEMAFEWLNHDLEVICDCHRYADEFLFTFKGHAQFHIVEGVITCFDGEGVSMQMIRHLLLNQIIPRYLATFGKLILHASAVTLENGKTVAFIGNSGFGKSTLASSFHTNKATLIGDDCVQVDIGVKGVTVVAAYRGIRLFPDSVSAVFNESAGFVEYSAGSDKQQLIVADEDTGKPPRKSALSAMFLLNDPKDTAGNEPISIKPVSGSTAMMAMINCAFSLDPGDKQLMTRNFRNIGSAIGKQIGIYSLRYPRQHTLLSDVRAAVIDCAEKLGSE